jgi:hypothetical protein
LDFANAAQFKMPGNSPDYFKQLASAKMPYSTENCSIGRERGIFHSHKYFIMDNIDLIF